MSHGQHFAWASELDSTEEEAYTAWNIDLGWLSSCGYEDGLCGDSLCASGTESHFYCVRIY